LLGRFPHSLLTGNPFISWVRDISL
jgi:hypothetical protein